MNKICIGILALTPGWKSLLDQIGVHYEVLDKDLPFEKNYSTIIINSKPENRLLKKLNVYLQDQGAILVTKEAKNTRFFYDHRLSPSPDFTSDFGKLITFSKVGDGLVAIVDFKPDQHISNNHYSRQRFYFKKGKHPDELVSTVDKEALFEAMITCFKHLHFHQELPFVHKWTSPGIQPVFCFRIDSDWGDKSSIEQLYRIAQDYNIPMTWFLHVEAHEHWLDYFHTFENQEIALHGYKHGTSKSYEHVINNIENGFQLLKDADLEPKGFCAPYGIWNQALADVLKFQNFCYSSEFTIGYDTFPFYPVHENEIHPTLQIPIHPICTGSLNRKHVHEEEMLAYFLNALEARTSAFKNTIFYHHPLQKGVELWKKVFEKVNELELNTYTFIDYAEFWKQRLEFNIASAFDLTDKKLHLNSSNNELYVSVSFDHHSFYLIPASQTNTPLSSFEKREINRTHPQLNRRQLNELSEVPLELMKTSLLDWKNRKKL